MAPCPAAQRAAVQQALDSGAARELVDAYVKLTHSVAAGTPPPPPAPAALPTSPQRERCSK